MTTQQADQIVDLTEQVRQGRERLLIAKIKPRFWLARTVVVLEVLVLLVAVSWFEPDSLTAIAINATGGYGWYIVAALGVFCGAGLLDTLVNDLMPDRFHLRWAMHWRHLGFMGMALMLAVIGVLVVFHHGFTPLILAYWLNALLAAALTFLDAFARLRRP